MACRASPGMGPRMGLETAQRSGNQSFLDSFTVARPRVLVIGCGGAGGNSVHRLHRIGIHGARTVVVNTDAVHLDSIQADRKILIGGGVTRGMGAGERTDVVERCAELAEQELRNQIGDSDLTFVTVGLGGGTGTGIAPFLAELAQAAGSVVIALATTPFRAERGRMNNARAGIQRLQSCSDSLIVLDNNRLLDLVPNLPVEQAFAVMDHLISEVVKGLTAGIRPDANVIFGVRVDRKYEGILPVLAIMTGVRSPIVEGVAESVSLRDVVSDGGTPGIANAETLWPSRRR